MDNAQKKALDILSSQYVIENGILDNGQFFYEYEDENGVTNEGQVYDKPRVDGGKPINNLVYTVYPSGELESYYYLLNGAEDKDRTLCYAFCNLNLSFVVFNFV